MWAEPGLEFRVASEKGGRLHFMLERFRDSRGSVVQKLILFLEGA